MAALEDRLDRDLERGVTGIGPHLDDVVLASGGRELRSFGSQGEQRLAVLALLLAEAELIVERRGVPPLLLLDDVLSELDPEPPADPGGPRRAGRPGARHRDRRGDAPCGARPAARGDAGGGARSAA